MSNENTAKIKDWIGRFNAGKVNRPDELIKNSKPNDGIEDTQSMRILVSHARGKQLKVDSKTEIGTEIPKEDIVSVKAAGTSKKRVVVTESEKE